MYHLKVVRNTQRCLHRPGYQPAKMAYELVDGTVKEYPCGLVRIEIMGEITAGRVIFGEPGADLGSYRA